VIPRKDEKSKTRRFRGKRGKKRSEYLNKDERENETPFSLKAFLTGSLSPLLRYSYHHKAHCMKIPNKEFFFFPSPCK
jgi:hypothetical protein